MDDLVSGGNEECSHLWRCCAKSAHWIYIKQILKIMTFLLLGAHSTWDLFWLCGLSGSKACKCSFCFLTVRAKPCIPPLLRAVGSSAVCSWIIPVCLFYRHWGFFTLIAVGYFIPWNYFAAYKSNSSLLKLLKSCSGCMSSSLTEAITIGARSFRKYHM